MLLFEAKSQIDERLQKCDFKELIPDYIEALEIVSKCIEAQMRLADVLNDFFADCKETDTFSAKLIYDILEQFRFDFEEEQDERA